MVVLSGGEIDRFMDEGFVRVRAAFDRNLAEAVRDVAAEQLRIDLGCPSTWTSPVVRGMVTGEPLRRAAASPALNEAIGQLLHGEDWAPRQDLGAFVVRFPSNADPGDAGWHIDSSFQPPGDERWFVNYRSKHRGLLLLCLVSDVAEDDAPTRILVGSHRKMPDLLRPAGEAGLPGAFAGQRSQIPLPDTAGVVELAVGDAGDVFVCHPFLVHAASWPHRGATPRFVTQPPIGVSDSLNLDRPRSQLSPVASAIRRALST